MSRTPCIMSQRRIPEADVGATWRPARSVTKGSGAGGAVVVGSEPSRQPAVNRGITTPGHGPRRPALTDSKHRRLTRCAVPASSRQLTAQFRNEPAKTRGQTGTVERDPAMNRSNASAALAIAAVLTLAGCGGPAPSGTTASASPSPASPDPTPTPTPKAYTNEELTAIVAGLKDAQGQPLTVVPAAQIDQGLIAAREMLENRRHHTENLRCADR